VVGVDIPPILALLAFTRGFCLTRGFGDKVTSKMGQLRNTFDLTSPMHP
jgi:hypothetical protein